MGLRGPIAKSDALKEREGNTGKRRLTKSQSKTAALVHRAPVAPRHLDATAKWEWKRLVKLLQAEGMLRELDRTLLAELCATISTLTELRRILGREREKFGRLKKRKTYADGPLFSKSASGYVQLGPLVIAINTHIGIVKDLSLQFGLSPAARKRLAIAGDGYLAPGEGESAEAELARILSSD